MQLRTSPQDKRTPCRDTMRRRSRCTCPVQLRICVGENGDERGWRTSAARRGCKRTVAQLEQDAPPDALLYLPCAMGRGMEKIAMREIGGASLRRGTKTADAARKQRTAAQLVQDGAPPVLYAPCAMARMCGGEWL